MLRTIIRKEVQTNVLSFRFVTSLAMLLLIVPVTCFILTNDYLQTIDEFSARRTEVENYLKSYAHFNRVQNVIRPARPPLPFQSLIRGLSPDINIDEFDDDPLPVMFPLLDLVFIVSILMSLAALVFAYDAVCGEREDGTLKLMLAGGVSRAKIILGKMAGGVLTLLVPFALSLVAGLLVIALQPRVHWSGEDWAALGLILAGAVIFLALFYGLGLLISARHRTSASSIMTSLFVWVLLVLVIPNLSPYVASFLAPTPSRIKVDRETARIMDTERDDLGRRLSKERIDELAKRYPVLAESISEAQAKERVGADSAFREAWQARRREVQAAWDEANRIQRERAAKLWDDLTRREAAQTRLSLRLSMISPLADFTYLATDLSSTGIRNEAHFGEVERLYWESYRDYVRQKTEALQKQDPATDWWNTAVDMSDLPRFRYRVEALGGRLKGALPPFAALLGWTILLFAAAYVSFIRYDVR